MQKIEEPSDLLNYGTQFKRLSSKSFLDMSPPKRLRMVPALC